MFEFLLGFGTALFLIVFVGWIDVVVLNKPIIELRDSSPLKVYLFYSAWEFLFVIVGFLIGYMINGG